MKRSYCIFLSLPKTPVGSFNKSNAHTPLVSPLTMIREEDLEVGNLVFDLMGFPDIRKTFPSEISRFTQLISMATPTNLKDAQCQLAGNIR